MLFLGYAYRKRVGSFDRQRSMAAGIRSQEEQLAPPHSVHEKRFERFKIKESGRDPCGRTNVWLGRENPGCGLLEVA